MDRLKLTCERIAARGALFLGGRFFLGCCLAIVTLCVTYQAFRRPFHAWNDVRLARTFALFGNQEIYPTANEGPILAGIYGPVGFAAYAPATLFSSPNIALAAGVLLSIVMGFAPVLLILLHPSLALKADRSMRLLILCYVFFHLYFSAAAFGLWNIHVDAPAVALCGLGLCGVLLHGGRARFSWALGCSVLAFALAPWAKQTSAPLLLAPPLYFWAIGNRRAVFEFLAAFAAVECLLMAGFGTWFGFERLYFSLMAVPSHHPRNIAQLAFAGRQVEDFLDMAALAALAIFAACLLRQQTSLPEGKPGATSFDWGAWPVFLVAALLALPTSILGRIKDGGTDNNYALVDYCLTIAVALYLLRLTALPSFRVHPVLPRVLPVTIGLLLCLQMLRTIPDIVRLPGQFSAFLRGSPSQQAYEFAREHPGKVYFPWYPLAALQAEGRLYHVTYGIYQRELAGFEVTREHLLQDLPASMEHLAVMGEVDVYTQQVLPEYHCPVQIEGLSAWTVLAREQNGACVPTGSNSTAH